MERRSVLILAVPVGLALGAAIWLAAGGGDSRAVAATQARLDVLPRARAVASRNGAGVGAQALTALPLFNQRGPARELSVRLVGIARSPGRAAALLSIDGAPAQWINVGQTVGDVTLEALSAAGVSLSTPNGLQEVALGSSLGPATSVAASPSAAPMAALAAMESGPPPGFRGPSPPASAPGGVP